MSGDIQREQLSKISPLKKVGYLTLFGTIAGITLPFAFGINTFAWIASWVMDNWPRLIIIAGFVVWMGKSHLSG